ncbi:MAG: hypothetical protein ACREND_03335, partial [Gemmatimonadaceae bacterium]
MDVVVPNGGTTLDAVVGRLAHGGGPRLLSQLGPQTGEVQIRPPPPRPSWEGPSAPSARGPSGPITRSCS